MSFRKQKKAALYEKLRAVTNSNAMNKTSIIVDASKYIGKLKERVDRLNQEIGSSQVPTVETSVPVQVTVETLEKGFLVNVVSENECPGLLISILEAFEELGLDVLDARVSCTDNFQLEAVGGENQGNTDSIDAQVVKKAVIEAINDWAEQ
ncbi:hypothetical protein Tsubulata_015684 [Turnera subulata]|uniref:Plant bHLH transcription factor ACT-like domain-containing protein n=1 Tax=Turnera subulata TaxID=218843 RepID=A0A9Q0G156_9ROSI|nr:hypothetical protein Tsubulata_015684 [Turnera subulata]